MKFVHYDLGILADQLRALSESSIDAGLGSTSTFYEATHRRAVQRAQRAAEVVSLPLWLNKDNDIERREFE
jgi:hypothetical protein